MDNGVYALTFDDGPSMFTPGLLRMLTGYPGMPVSFFLIGGNLDALPCIANDEFQAHFTQLSHTYTHPHLTSLTAAQVYTEMAKTTKAFVNSGLCRRPTLYRPPYGDTNAAVKSTCCAMRLIVSFSVCSVLSCL